MTTKAEKAEQQFAIKQLQGMLKKGDRLYTINRHVSQSGMTRHISVFRVNESGEIETIDWLIHRAGIFKRTNSNNREGLKVSGCGMDMGFHVVYSLSSVVLNDGYALKQSWL
jgi:hypothetical protein